MGCFEKGHKMSPSGAAQEPAHTADPAGPRTAPQALALERALLQELADCKRKLTKALEDLKGIDVPQAGDDPRALAQHIAQSCSRGGPEQACLGAVYRRYHEIRTRLALANMKLVAH